MKGLLIVCLSFFLLSATAQKGTKELVYQDKAGVVRWNGTKKEVALFGANYCLPSACDYRAAGYVTNDRKKVVDADMAHFARMGWDALRLCLWGDWENSDTLGNLVNNDHLNLMDYVIFKAKERGIYFLLSPIVTYSSQWPDAMQDTISAKGFSTYFKKGELGTNPRAIAAQQNYLTQLLNHVNLYTGVALKNEPNILFIEMINEPWHHSDDVQGSVRYINALVDAVRNTGCNKILFHNYSQDFAMAKPMQQSKIQGVSFAWYPSGLNSGNTLSGNYLPVVDHYSPEMLRPEISKKAKIVYEFDSPDLLTGYMYPAMARAFREVGAQWASMFSYDMLATAPYNLGWQTHCLNMVYTPTKAASAIIAAEVMKNIPRLKKFGNYPTNTTFGPFQIDYAQDLSVMNTADKFLYANSTSIAPQNSATLQKIVGYGSSPVVRYEGKGLYFLDKIKTGTWRLEVYPDAAQVADPFNMPSPDKIVIRAIHRNWPMTIQLPDLGSSFSVQALNAGNDFSLAVQNGTFNIKPGVYILTTDNAFNRHGLLKKLGNINMDEFYCPDDQALPPQVALIQQPSYYAGKDIVVSANVYSQRDPQHVTLFVKSGAGNFFPMPMQRDSGYTYKASIPAAHATEGWLEYCIVVKDSNTTINYPSRISKSPDDWDFSGSSTWKAAVVKERTPLNLVTAGDAENKIAFTRIGDGIRYGIYKIIPSSQTGAPAFHLELPLSYDKHLKDYTISVPVTNKIAARKEDISGAKTLLLQARGVNEKQQAYITLVENDGTSWSKKIDLKGDWNNIRIPLNELELSKGAMLPLGYPGDWKYWFEPAAGRSAKDGVKPQNIGWIQLSMRPSDGKKEGATEASWIDLTTATLSFE